MDSEVSKRVDAIRSQAGFDIPAWWLTFYMTASTQRLDALSAELTPFRAVNLGDSEGGFLYPKVPTQSSAEAVCATIAAVSSVADRCGVEVIAVDVDTAADVAKSQFAELIRYASDGS